MTVVIGAKSYPEEIIEGLSKEHKVYAINGGEIAAELGYYDYSHFYKAFEREVGISPGEYLGEG